MLPLFGNDLITIRIKSNTGETAEKRIGWIYTCFSQCLNAMLKRTELNLITD